MRSLGTAVLALATVSAAVAAQPLRPDAADGANAGPYIARAWGTGDGLPQNSVTSMVQTRDGYLWLGTFGGLVRFDGNSFTVFNPENTPGLSSARIVSLLEAHDGALWIGTESGLTRFDHGVFTTFTAKDGLSQSDVSAAFEDKAGRIWLGRSLDVVRYDRGTFTTMPVGRYFGTSTIVGDEHGGIWVGTLDGIMHLPDGEHPSFTPSRGSQVVKRLFVDSQRRLWQGALTLSRLDGDRWVEVPLPVAQLNYGAISALAEDQDGVLWIGTSYAGVFRIRNGVAEPYRDVAAANDAIRSLFADRDGNMWIGTDVAGLVRLKPRRVFSYQREGASQQSIGPIIGDGADGLWIGGTCGGLLHFQAGRFFEVFDEKHGLPHDCIWSLARDPDGTLWMGTSGVVRFKDGHSEAFAVKGDLADPRVSVVFRDRDGAIWVGHTDGLSRLEGKHFVHYGPEQDVHPVVTIMQTRAGDLWLGGTGVISRFRDGRISASYSPKDGLSTSTVRAIHEDQDGVMWIGTYGGGLHRLKDGRITTFTVKDGLYDSVVSRIIEDDRGNMWMSGNRGIYRVSRAQLNAFADGKASYITSVSYGTADGMITDETNGGQPAGWQSRDGMLWFPTIKGLVGIAPEGPAASPPPVAVERTIVNGNPIDPGAAPRGRADAEFHYTAIDLRAAEKTRFRYRLDGYDDTWIEAGSRRVAYYTGIQPGRYTFQVIATNSDGDWGSSPVRVAVVVIPFWWQRRETMVAALLLLVAVTGFVVRYATLRRARARVAELERERALERERSRIARDLHDDLGSRLTHIAMMADSASDTSIVPRIGAAARDAAQTMRELVWAVNAPNDTIESFASYFALFAEEHVVAAKIRCRILLPPDLPARPLAADVRRHLYLACKEAVNNAVKHAQATEIRVSFRLDRTDLVVEIADDGRGLPADIDPRGNGLKNYRERMEAARGTVAIESSPQTGTRVTFRVQL